MPPRPRRPSSLPALALASLGLLGLPSRSSAQGSRADYERALSLPQRTENRVFRARVRPHWLPGHTRFWYRLQTGPDAQEYVIVDAAAGTRTVTNAPPEAAAPLAARPGDHLPRRSRRTGEDTAITFVNESGRDLELYWLDPEGQRRGYGRVRAGQERRQATFAGHVWLLVDAEGNAVAAFEATAEPNRAILTGELAARAGGERAAEPVAPKREPGESPDGRWVALVRDHNVHLRPKSQTLSQPLSTNGTADHPYHAEFAWAPDSSALVARQVRPGGDRQVQFIEAAPRDQLQPRLHSHRYLKPGDPLPLPRLRVFSVTHGRSAEVDPALYETPFTESGDLDLQWTPDSRRFRFDYNQRGHQVFRILEVDVTPLREPGTGPLTLRPRTVVEETSATFIDWTNKTWRHWVEATGELLWMSERDGWAHLWLIDARTGTVRQQVTRGSWVVRRVLEVDETRRQVWFLAGGLLPGQDPYHLHLARVNFDGTGLQVLTAGDGTHEVAFSPDRRWFLDTWSRVDQPPVTELRRADDGTRVLGLETADATALMASGWTVPERFVAPGRDGATPIHGILIRPSNFDPARRYPVIEEIYAGPHGAFVPKEFGRLPRQQALAELGFVVVQIDGMGTNHRGKRFQDVAWRNLGDSGFPDRIAWLRAAAATRPWMDLGRVGIYGGSAGGQSSTRALLAHGDFYRVAVSDCGCHDNRMDKIWWNEAWMGWPIGPWYAESSNVTHAVKLRGRLLLTVGELDRNVDPASTMQVANALLAADKDFELVVVPGGGHGVGESPALVRRRQDFFVRHLHGVEPRGK